MGGRGGRARRGRRRRGGGGGVVGAARGRIWKGGKDWGGGAGQGIPAGGGGPAGVPMGKHAEGQIWLRMNAVWKKAAESEAAG